MAVRIQLVRKGPRPVQLQNLTRRGIDVGSRSHRNLPLPVLLGIGGPPLHAVGDSPAFRLNVRPHLIQFILAALLDRVLEEECDVSQWRKGTGQPGLGPAGSAVGVVKTEQLKKGLCLRPQYLPRGQVQPQTGEPACIAKGDGTQRTSVGAGGLVSRRPNAIAVASASARCSGSRSPPARAVNLAASWSLSHADAWRGAPSASHTFVVMRSTNSGNQFARPSSVNSGRTAPSCQSPADGWKPCR